MYSPELRYLSGFVRLAVPDLEAAVAWYGAALGFTPVTGGTEGGAEWRHLRRGEGQDLVLVAAPHPARFRLRAAVALAAGLLRVPAAGPVNHLAVDQDLGEVKTRARQHGARVSRRRRASVAGTVAFNDPYGNEWVFFSRQPGGGGPLAR